MFRGSYSHLLLKSDENMAKNLANQFFFILVNNQKFREDIEVEDCRSSLSSLSASLSAENEAEDCNIPSTSINQNSAQRLDNEPVANPAPKSH